MKHKTHCEICGGFGEVGFTDVGIICEGCYNLQVSKNCFNQGIEFAAKSLEKMPHRLAPIDCAIHIRTLKKELHKAKSIAEHSINPA